MTMELPRVVIRIQRQYLFLPIQLERLNDEVIIRAAGEQQPVFALLLHQNQLPITR